MYPGIISGDSQPVLPCLISLAIDRFHWWQLGSSHFPAPSFPKDIIMVPPRPNPSQKWSVSLHFPFDASSSQGSERLDAGSWVLVSFSRGLLQPEFLEQLLSCVTSKTPRIHTLPNPPPPPPPSTPLVFQELDCLDDGSTGLRLSQAVQELSQSNKRFVMKKARLFPNWKP